MPYEYTVTRRVEFNETDMAGIVHFSNFFKYMETVEHAFWRSLGYSVILPNYNPPLGLPRVHASCDYKRPLRFEDVVELHMKVTAKTRRSISYEIRFRRIEPGPPEEVAIGHLTVVCVQKNLDGGIEAVPFPEELASQIEVAPGVVPAGSPEFQT